ncbi:MAG: hypothetical protein GX456_15915 [Verrucomicrobia bacterium]|nr:hypothetical protein [Verrucomicrobiota bacterium]
METATALGARPSPAASTRRPSVRPVSITQISRPNIDRLGAAKNRRAPIDALETAMALGSAAVPGRIKPTPDRTTGFNHANPAPERPPVGCGQECPRSCRRWRKQRRRERGRPRPHQPDARSYDWFQSRKSGATSRSTGWVAESTCPATCLSPYR